VVRRGDAILVTRRRDEPGARGQWEFPGGKVEPGEREEEALAREIREELGCEVEVGRLLLRHVHRYPEREVALAFYACALAGGAEPRPLGVAELAWARAGTLARYDFLEADRAVLAELERLVTGATS
jgi:8-oxo-dGTP diphosphatase